MTRKDYELIADAIAQSTDLEDFAETIADVMASDNPNFDRRRFYDRADQLALVAALPE